MCPCLGALRLQVAAEDTAQAVMVASMSQCSSHRQVLSRFTLLGFRVRAAPAPCACSSMPPHASSWPMKLQRLTCQHPANISLLPMAASVQACRSTPASQQPST